MHEKLNHRKCKKYDLRAYGIEMSARKIREVLSRCTVCQEHDVTMQVNCKIGKIDYPGEHIRGRSVGNLQKKANNSNY